MHILFTGATGLIGQHFIGHFKQYDYTVLTRSPRRAMKMMRKQTGNRRFIAALSALTDLDCFDAVINLAGEPIIDKRWSQKQKARICHSRWQTTQELVDLFAGSSKPPGVFVSGSAIGYYGETGADKVTEQDSARGDDFAGKICHQWETIAAQAQPYTRVVMLRTGIVLGDGGALGKMLLPFKLGLGGKVGSGRQYMSWIHIEDMIRAIDFLLTTDSAVGAFNLTAPQALTNALFTTTLAGVLGTKPRLPIPETLLRLLMGESAMLLLNSQNVYPQKLLKGGFEFTFSDLQAALVDLLKTQP